MMPHKPLLAVSGGKDSLACLMILKDHWAELDAIWIDTGDTPSGAEERIKLTTKGIQELHVVRTNSKSWREKNGQPVDFFPALDRYKQNAPILSSAVDCCMNNISQPIYDFAIANGYSIIINGTKECDKLHNRRGELYQAGELAYFCPIYKWTDAQVLTYLESIPSLTYLITDLSTSQSVDCISCTAFSHESRGPLPIQIKSTNEYMIQQLEEHLNHLKGKTYAKG